MLRVGSKSALPGKRHVYARWCSLRKAAFDKVMSTSE